jgi:disulfide bond formation protein DsbB
MNRLGSKHSATHRALMLLVLVGFLAAASGAATLLHAHHDEGDHSQPCQICYLINFTAVAVAVALVYLFFISEKAHGEHPVITAVVRSCDRPGASAPRAPPLD